ncbi:hypothetical protein V1525DRAFT_392237, partial [Lipomyces kononenkoae]
MHALSSDKSDSENHVLTSSPMSETIYENHSGATVTVGETAADQVLPGERANDWSLMSKLKETHENDVES